MSCQIAIVSDLHYSPTDSVPHSERRGDIADVLLLRAVHRMNRLIRPDLVVVAGDLIDDGEGENAVAAMTEMKDRLDLLNMPYAVVPGNHDGPLEVTEEVFGDVQEWIDLQGCRFVPFVDPEEPGFNARRTEKNLDRMREARRGFGGPLVAFQHVPVYPEGLTESRYNYTNASDVVDAMEENGFCMAIAGHYHEGFHAEANGMSFICAPATCSSPFPLTVVDIDDMDEAAVMSSGYPSPSTEVAHHNLRLPESSSLVDCHIHTEMAYCAEDVEVSRTLSLAQDFGLEGVGFSEHTNHLYFGSEKCRQAAGFNDAWADNVDPEQNRMKQYLNLLQGTVPARCRGFEVECRYDGGLVLAPDDADGARYIIGGMHRLPEQEATNPSRDRMAEQFLNAAERFTATDIDVLAHPFRIFRRSQMSAPRRLFEPLARMLREYDVAAEVNFHTNQPPETFFRMCLDSGVKLTFGSDAHNVYEIGDFGLHIDFLRRCGFNGELSDVIVDPRKEANS